ncbi:MAG: hypothetical protein ACRECJ_07845, partial [Limisphaerales bacterium]
MVFQGYVRDANGSPVVGADLDFDDAATGQRVTVEGDKTVTLGFYRVILLAGFYHVSYAPPGGTRLVGQRFLNVDITTHRQFDVTLPFGLVDSGRVTDSTTGTPVGKADIDVEELRTG